MGTIGKEIRKIKKTYCWLCACICETRIGVQICILSLFLFFVPLLFAILLFVQYFDIIEGDVTKTAMLMQRACESTWVAFRLWWEVLGILGLPFSTLIGQDSWEAVSVYLPVLVVIPFSIWCTKLYCDGFSGKKKIVRNIRRDV